MTENVRMFRSKEKNVDDKYNNDYFPYKIHRKYQKQSIVIFCLLHQMVQEKPQLHYQEQFKLQKKKD